MSTHTHTYDTYRVGLGSSSETWFFYPEMLTGWIQLRAT